MVLFITTADPSAFKSITATGQGMRRVYDRRTDSSSTMNAYLFKVEWRDGLTSEIQVNPEFGDSAAQVESQKYAVIVGRIPTCLRKDVKAITIHSKSEGISINAYIKNALERQLKMSY